MPGRQTGAVDGLVGYLVGAGLVAAASVNVWLQWRRWRSVSPRLGGRRRRRST